MKQKALEKNQPQYLTRTFLQQDELCQESPHLLPLLGRIFDCSDRLEGYHALHCEQIAGFRYFIPNGRLAAEWKYFFQIIPDRYMQMVACEVRFAYENQKSLESCSMEGWVEASLVWTDTQEKERSHPYYRHLRANDEGYAPQIPSSQVPSMKRKRNSPEPDRIGPSLLSPGAKRLRTSSPAESDSIVTPYSKSLRPGQQTAQVPMATTQAILTPALSDFAMAPDSPQVQATASLGLPHPVASTAPAVTTDPTHQLVIPRVPIPLSKQARGHPAPPQPPGTVEHTGRGNVSKAWSKERIRAFTQIQGYPRQELPLSAVSEYGDELSRDHTPKSIDPRCCPFPTTIEENLTVSLLVNRVSR
jgi:hypothetical protein